MTSPVSIREPTRSDSSLALNLCGRDKPSNTTTSTLELIHYLCNSSLEEEQSALYQDIKTQITELVLLEKLNTLECVTLLISNPTKLSNQLTLDTKQLMLKQLKRIFPTSYLSIASLNKLLEELTAEFESLQTSHVYDHEKLSFLKESLTLPIFLKNIFSLDKATLLIFLLKTLKTTSKPPLIPKKRFILLIISVLKSKPFHMRYLSPEIIFNLHEICSSILKLSYRCYIIEIIDLINFLGFDLALCGANSILENAILERKNHFIRALIKNGLKPDKIESYQKIASLCVKLADSALFRELLQHSLTLSDVDFEQLITNTSKLIRASILQKTTQPTYSFVLKQQVQQLEEMLTILTSTTLRRNLALS